MIYLHLLSMIPAVYYGNLELIHCSLHEMHNEKWLHSLLFHRETLVSYYIFLVVSILC